MALRLYIVFRFLPWKLLFGFSLRGAGAHDEMHPK
jgi:hypothetical protein